MLLPVQFSQSVVILKSVGARRGALRLGAPGNLLETVTTVPANDHILFIFNGIFSSSSCVTYLLLNRT